jgi:Fe-S-cluster containining protein
MAEPWYHDGLRFTCTRCGNCCTGAPGYVWVTPAETAALAEQLGEPVETVRAVYTRQEGRRRSLREKANGDCVFYEHGTGCTVYAARPTQCRTWPFWASTTETAAAWQQTQTICPGAGRGELIPAEEITRRVRAIKL